MDFYESESPRYTQRQATVKPDADTNCLYQESASEGEMHPKRH